MREVLDSQELKNLGAEIKDSFTRAGEDLRDSFSASQGPRPGRYSRRPPDFRQAPPPPPPGSGWTSGGMAGGSPGNPPGGQPRGSWKTPGRPQMNWNRGWQNARQTFSQGWQKSWSQPVSEGPYRGRVVAREPRWKRGGAAAAAILGWMGTAFGGFMLLGTGLAVLFDNVYNLGAMIGLMIGFTAFTAACASIGVAGTVKLSGKNRMRKIWLDVKGRDFCKLSEVAGRLKLEERKVLRAVEKMLALRLLPQGHLDETKTCLMLTDETYARYLESRQEKAEEEKREREAAEDPQKAALAKMMKEGSGYIRRMREINNDLPEEGISDKLDSLETVCQQIFAYVADHPGRLPAIRKFISYYLPTTMKLCEAYYKLDRQNTGAESEQKTMEEILSALDNIDLAFHNLLDDLMENEYLDLSADISVLQSMMAQEGLMDDFDLDGEPSAASGQTPPAAGKAPQEPGKEPESYEPELHI